MQRYFNRSKPGKHRLSSFSLSAILIFLLVLLLILSQFQPPKPDRLIQTEQTLTLSSIADFPIMGYASLTFSEGGGLYRLYDRQNLSLLQTGESYTLTAGIPHASGGARGRYQLPNYTAIIDMSSTSGTVITTAADYEAESSAPMLSVLTAVLAVTIVLFVLHLLLILLRALIRFIK